MISSPALASSPESAARPPPLPRSQRSNFAEEPNPFEESFRRPANPTSSVRSSRPKRSSIDAHHNTTNNDVATAAAAAAAAAANLPDDQPRPPSAESSSSHKSGSPKPTLPPLASINSPSDQYPWGTTLTNSLRAGPLSPAMLAGPAQSSSDAAALSFDSATGFRFGRTGLTPGTGSGTGLTPLLGGPVVFPPPSPGTAAFLNMMSNTGSGPTITPNTLNAITGVLSSAAAAANANGSATPAPSQGPHPLSVSHVPYEHTNGSQQQQQQHNGQESYAQSASNAAATAANGLFLLSQAHQELAKREEAQQRAGQQQQQSQQQQAAPAQAQNGRRGTKRKQSQDEDHSPPAKATPAKRTRQNTQSQAQARVKAQTPSFDEEEEDDDDEEDDLSSPTDPLPAMNGGKKNPKKPETEEEKRKNFLERNRQAALKCRQRKKAWLAQLQAKVEFLAQENERLQAALVTAREEIARLSATAVIPAQNGAHPGAPVSVNVALPQSQKVAAGGGRGYGY